MIKIKGEKLYIDISLPSKSSRGGKKNWLLVVGDFTNHGQSYFLKEKLELKDVMMALIKDLKVTEGIDIRHVPCDNGGENEALRRLCKQEGIGVKFEIPCSGLHNKTVGSNGTLLFN